MTEQRDLDYVADRAASKAASAVLGQVPSMDAIEELVNRTAGEAASKAAKEAATTAVYETLVSFGLDPKDRINVMKDFIFMSELRKTLNDMKRHGILALVAMCVTALGVAVWAYVKTGGNT